MHVANEIIFQRFWAIYSGINNLIEVIPATFHFLQVYP